MIQVSSFLSLFQDREQKNQQVLLQRQKSEIAETLNLASYALENLDLRSMSSSLGRAVSHEDLEMIVGSMKSPKFRR